MPLESGFNPAGVVAKGKPSTIRKKVASAQAYNQKLKELTKDFLPGDRVSISGGGVGIVKEIRASNVMILIGRRIVGYNPMVLTKIVSTPQKA